VAQKKPLFPKPAQKKPKKPKRHKTAQKKPNRHKKNQTGTKKTKTAQKKPKRHKPAQSGPLSVFPAKPVGPAAQIAESCRILQSQPDLWHSVDKSP
jgi:hypothetical protein